MVVLLASGWAGLCAPAASESAASGLTVASGVSGVAPAAQGARKGRAAARGAIYLQAQAITGRVGEHVVASGDVELRSRELLIAAQQLELDTRADRLSARGDVRMRRGSDRFTGSALELAVNADQGWIDQPTYFFGQTGASGSARRIEIEGEQRIRAFGANYSSCPIVPGQAPAWQIAADEVSLDFAANEGIAHGGVLRFFGLPLLPTPAVTFPVTDARKSGWLAPQVVLYDTRSGSQVLLPYYWNLAPNYDLTVAPYLSTRRGPGLDSEFRYLQSRFEGDLRLNVLPHDTQANRTRYVWAWQQKPLNSDDRWQIESRFIRVSDDAYWKDFTTVAGSVTPRLLPSSLKLQTDWGPDQRWQAYARAQQWQVLRDASTPDAQLTPYARLPQLGLRGGLESDGGPQASVELEYNRFVSPLGAAQGLLPAGERVHGLARLAWPLGNPAWRLEPQLALNTAAYSMEAPLSSGAYAGRSRLSRTVPSLSVDGALFLERETDWFGRALLQTLEPRLFYSLTPFRNTAAFPNFDSAPRDFNFESIYTANAFTGVDRVSDANQLTAGLTTRWVNAQTGEEALRLGVVQRYRFDEQRIVAGGTRGDSRFSDVLLLGGTSLIPGWRLETALQYNPDIGRVVRANSGVRYSGGASRNLGMTYTATRGLSEQVSMAWQWPLFEQELASATGSTGPACGGRLNTVGRVNYSRLDARITSALAGLEYQSACWAVRLATERVSIGPGESNLRYMFQIELTGLSSLGSNPFMVLKDNILGYRPSSEGLARRASPGFYD
jgi:LPS-assembly protein